KSAYFPVVALRGLVVFPGQHLHFDVGREKSINAVNAAAKGNNLVFLVSQKSISDEIPDMDNIYTCGVIARIDQVLKVPAKRGLIHISVTGISRAGIFSMFENKGYLMGEVSEIPDKKSEKRNPGYDIALVRRTKDLFADYADVAPRMPDDMFVTILEEKDPGKLADYIAGNIMIEYTDRQKILEITDPVSRLEEVNVIIAEETYLLGLESEISDRVQEKMDKNQREYYLQEQLKTISEELNGFSPEDELADFRNKISALNASEEVKSKLLKECSRLEKMSNSSPDATVLRNYIETCVELPWGIYSEDNKDIAVSRKILEDDHYGLEKVKQRILEYLAVSEIAPDIKGQIICLVGPPGVGKTSIARSIARATGRKYTRIALGGVRDEAEIRGHRKTYIGSMPGRIIEALQKVKTANPLILLDEIDKLSADYKGDPTSALLEVLDPEQNFEFTDHYIELPFDLSRVLFITTTNVRSDIPAPLQDRMEIIELGSYTFEEKFNIAKKHLIPKQIKRHGLKRSSLRITDKALRLIIDGYTREAGVRALEQNIASVCRKCAVKIIEGEAEKISVTPDDIEKLLGARKFSPGDFAREDSVGVANGLAWTSVGGEMLEIESVVVNGNGKLQLTGSLGDVMKESAQTAVSYIRSKSDELKVDKDFYKNSDIHIHVPEGATPKDGPSAGITIATSLVSALTGNKIRSDIAMTGEITLRGRVLPIGGLREKSMAAYRAGIKTVIIPYGNVSDLDEVDEEVKKKISFMPVRTIDQVWDKAVEGFGKAGTQ
ncbi:MAG: endopeptidase La, partial [Clostridia bacterium]|nr:endopeptidase La [Clostridia bacterium]